MERSYAHALAMCIWRGFRGWAPLRLWRLRMPRTLAIALNCLLSLFEQASSASLLVRSSSANVVFRFFRITFSDLLDIEEICSDMPGRMLVSLDREQLFA